MKYSVSYRTTLNVDVEAASAADALNIAGQRTNMVFNGPLRDGFKNLDVYVQKEYDGNEGAVAPLIRR